jgi:hypothetical protein
MLDMMGQVSMAKLRTPYEVPKDSPTVSESAKGNQP